MSLILKAVVMGIVEGLTEFLPVSSTGHLIIAGDIINFKGSFPTMFEWIIQLGAILAVVVYYRRKITDSLKQLKPGQYGFNLWLKIFIAFIPSVVIGLAFNDYIEEHLFSPFSVAIALVVGAILMLLVETYFSRYRTDDMDKVGLKESLMIGFAQCLSIIPGMSRSASTIMGGRVMGLSGRAAAEFSFFLAIPTMFGATFYSLLKGFRTVTTLEWEALAVGFVVSFIVAFFVIDRFLAFLNRHGLKSFAYYRLIVGVLMIFLVLSGIIG